MSFFLTKGVLQQQANRAGGKQYALEFDNDYVDISPLTEVEGNNSRSIYVKFRWTSNDDPDINILCGNNIDQTREAFNFIFDSPTELRIAVNGGNIKFFIPSITDNLFHEILLTFEGTETKDFELWFDGEKITDFENNNQTVDSLMDDYWLGQAKRYEGRFVWKGDISKFAAYNSKISDSRIDSVFENGVNNSDSDLIRNYQFLTGEGDTLFDSKDNVDGTIYGAKWVEL